MDDTEFVEEEITRGFVDHDVDDHMPVVHRESMSECSIEEFDDAMEESTREGIEFIFGLSEFHGSNDGFVNTQVGTGRGSGCGFAPSFEETKPFFEGYGAKRKRRRVGGHFGL